MKSNNQCCKSNGDVRGMCFTCIGNLNEMTADTIEIVNKCPNLSYSVAYWIHNNNDGEETKTSKWRETRFLHKLNINWSEVYSKIYALTHDEDE